MELPKNILKQRIQNQEITYGIWNGLVDTVAAEIIAGAGFDWILIDGEHAPFDLRAIQSQLQAVAPYETAVVVRPPEGTTTVLKQLLDIGVQNVLVPMVESKEQAEALVSAMCYPPKGVRGVGTALARAAQWNRINNYFKKADDNMTLICQVESMKGKDNLEAIVQVEGVDGIFFGPSDMAASMGFIGQPNHPDVVKVLSEAIQTVRKHNKTAGILALTKEVAEDYRSIGANFLGVGVDTLMLAKAAKDLIETYKTKVKKENSNTKY